MGVSRGYGSLLASGGFEALLWTQVLSAFAISAFALSAVNPADFVLSAAIFAIPFPLFAMYSGKIADRFSKSRVLQVTGAFGIVIMLLAVAALISGRPELILSTLFLLGAQVTFFSPANYGIVREMFGQAQVTRANALLASTALAAVIIGAYFGIFIHARWSRQPLNIGFTLLAIAIAAWIVSLGIPRVPRADSMESDSKGAPKPVAWPITRISWVWFALPFYLQDITAIAAGFAAGGIAAGMLSGDYVEFGLVAPGLLLMGISSFGLATAPGHSLAFGAIAGFGAGIFVVPLSAFLQMQSAPARKGRIFATNNAVNVAGACAGLFGIHLLHGHLQHGRSVFPALGTVMLASSFYLIVRMRLALFRFILWSIVHVLFRLRFEGQENIPETGGALLASNHMSYADAVLVGCLARWRTIHFLIWQPIFDVPVANYFFRMLDSIPIDAASPKNTVRALRAARAELIKGELAGIFPEGAISRTGEIQPFERGFEKLIEDTDLPIIPIRIDGLYGHPLSCKGGAPFRSWQKLWRPIVSVRAGAPIRRPVSPAELREAVLEA